MLALVKEPRIEISLSGTGEKISELLDFIRSRYTVDVLTPVETDGVQNAFETDFWKTVTPGDILAGCRLKHQLTQEELAEKSGIHQVVISDYETGKRKLSKRAAIKLGNALGENPDKFFRHITK